jgi:hypothetical protein
LEAASEPRSFLTRARASHPVKSRFSRLRLHFAPGSKSRLLRNLSGAGNALFVQTTLPSSTVSFSGPTFSSTGRIYKLRLQLPSIPLRGSLSGGGDLVGNKELLTDTGGTPPHNQRIEPTARRRNASRGHSLWVFSLGESRSGARSGHPPALLLRRRASGRCSRLIRALYGRWQGSFATCGSIS